MTDPTARDLIQRLADSVELLLQIRNGLTPLVITEATLAEARVYLAAPARPTVPSDTELHDLWLELYRFHDGPTGGEVATIARTALERWGYHAPASVAYEPTDAELLELMPETMQDEFAACASTYSAATGGQVKPGIFRTCLNTAALDYARVILARYGGDV